MKGSELRINNLVQLYRRPTDKEKSIHVVKQIGEDLIMCEDGFLVNVITGINPIPLTEEWLVKLGFKEYSKHINGDFELCIKSDKPSHHIVVRVYRMGFSVFNHSECDFTEIQFINRVKHVHTLQNLYFALTGEELKIK